MEYFRNICIGARRKGCLTTLKQHSVIQSIEQKGKRGAFGWSPHNKADLTDLTALPAFKEREKGAAVSGSTANTWISSIARERCNIICY